MHHSRLRIFVLPVLVLALGVTFLAACSDGDDDPGPTPPPTNETPSPGPTEPVDPTPSPEPNDPSPSPGGPIGVPAFDGLAADFVSGDIPAVVDAIDYIELECKTVQGLGGPPECRPGEAEGTVVPVVAFSSCEGEYKREDQLTPLLEAQADRGPDLYAAFSLKDRGTPERPLGEYGILFSLDGGAGIGELGLMLGVSAEGDLIGLWAGCGATPSEILERFAGDEMLLEPAA